MFDVVKNDPVNPFGKIPIHSIPLVHELKIHHLTVELNTHVPAMTGNPPQIAYLHKINTANEYCKDIKAAVLDFKAELRDSVSQAIDKKNRGERDQFPPGYHGC
jgi:hypothetical protein